MEKGGYKVWERAYEIASEILPLINTKREKQPMSFFLENLIEDRNQALAEYDTEQIKVLNIRLRYVKLMQFFSGLSFLFNLFTIIIGIFEIKFAIIFFIPAILFFSIAIIFFLIEINLSSNALKTHLQDLEQIDSHN